MNLKKSLTPKDVEEIKPNFFIQKKGNSYRQVHPLVWNNQWRLKGQIQWRNLLMVVLIIVLFTQGSKYVHFYEEVNSNPKDFCRDVSILDFENYARDTNTISIDSGESSRKNRG